MSVITLVPLRCLYCPPCTDEEIKTQISNFSRFTHQRMLRWDLNPDLTLPLAPKTTHGLLTKQSLELYSTKNTKLGREIGVITFKNIRIIDLILQTGN